MRNKILFSCEKELVILLKSNHKGAFEYVYDHYSPGLYGIVCKIVKDEVKANDVMQDAFMKIWKNVGFYDAEKGTLFTWMLNVARNTAIDALRADKKFETSISWTNVPESALTSISIFTPLPGLIDLRSILDTLSVEKKLLIKMVYLEGYTHEEVSAKLSIPLGTVKSRIRKALQDLRTIFSDPVLGLRLA